MDVSDLAVAPLEPHYVVRLRIGAVFEDLDHLPTLEPMSSPLMADAMRRAPQAATETSLMAPADADPRHHTRVCLRRGRGLASSRMVAVPKFEILTAQ
jgi:hypothetical protein